CVQCVACGWRVKERGRPPVRRSAAIERALVHAHGVRRTTPIEPEARIEYVALAVERERRVPTGIVNPARQTLDSRYKRPEMIGMRGDAAPGRPAVIRVVRPGI